MDKDIEYIEKDYITSQVATMLDIAIPTVRKYCQMLESKGYAFLKRQGTGQHQTRVFFETDISALRYLKDMREKAGTTVDMAASIVIEEFGYGNSEAIQPVTRTDIQDADGNGERYNELKDMIQQQNDLIRELTDKMDNQQTYIDKRMNERDQLLLQTLDKKQNEKKKGFFGKLFNKDDAT